MLQFEEEQFKYSAWWWELGQNSLILTFYCPVWPEQLWVLTHHRNTWTTTLSLHRTSRIITTYVLFVSGNVLFVPVTHRILGLKAPRRAGMQHLECQNLAGKHQLTSGQPLHSWKPGTVLGLGLQPLGSSLLHPLEIQLPQKLLKMQLSFPLQNNVNI